MPRDFESVDYLRDEQYANEANLTSRVDLHRLYSTNAQGWFRWVFDHLGLGDASSVLELGCGEGGLWGENLGRIPRGTRFILTDFSPGMLDAARSRLASSMPNARFEVVDAQSIPYQDATFDRVIANHMLYHVPDIGRALAEVRRVLKPDGHFLASTNGKRHLIELDQLVRAYSPAAHIQNPTRYFDLDQAEEPLSRVFAHVERDDYPDSLDVTDSIAVIRYLFSTPAKTLLTETRVRDLRQALDNQIALSGSFRITKEAGLFVCDSRIPGREAGG